jgi:hypothetical protein
MPDDPPGRCRARPEPAQGDDLRLGIAQEIGGVLVDRELFPQGFSSRSTRARSAADSRAITPSSAS